MQAIPPLQSSTEDSVGEVVVAARHLFSSSYLVINETEFLLLLNKSLMLIEQPLIASVFNLP